MLLAQLELDFETNTEIYEMARICLAVFLQSSNILHKFIHISLCASLSRSVPAFAICLFTFCREVLRNQNHMEFIGKNFYRKTIVVIR